MLLSNGHHLAYCTNIHRGETWQETLSALEQFTLPVRNRVCPNKPYAIGLRVSDEASRELAQPQSILHFRRWLERNNCYIFTINGFPFGKFHGERVKEKVYLPDWMSQDRLNYTNRLFDILAQLVPHGVEGSVSTVPGSFKELVKGPEHLRAIRANIFHCLEHIARVSAQTGRNLHLALEPEPLCLLETTNETVLFFDRLKAENHNDARIREHLAVNYDTCHIAVEFETPQDAIARLRKHDVKISKIHLSSALKLFPTAEARAGLAAFADDTYLHQVVARGADGRLSRHRDLNVALTSLQPAADPMSEEWRVHFHIPLHSVATEWMDNTSDHLLGVLDILQQDPRLCSYLEMETYTWEVLPPELKSRSVVDQLVAEYEWCLAQMSARGLA